MRVAIIGAAGLNVDISEYVPKETTAIISGGVSEIERLAEQYADERGLPKLIIRPDYQCYGLAAPFEQLLLIIDCAEIVLAFWNGKSSFTQSAINYSQIIGKSVQIIDVK